MRIGARTPEELETLLEDACIVGDAHGLRMLFEDGAVLAAAGGAEARGLEQIARMASALWAGGRGYVADSSLVVQSSDTALSVGSAISVLRRGSDGAWRYAIALMDAHYPPGEERR